MGLCVSDQCNTPDSNQSNATDQRQLTQDDQHHLTQNDHQDIQIRYGKISLDDIRYLTDPQHLQLLPSFIDEKRRIYYLVKSNENTCWVKAPDVKHTSYSSLYSTGKQKTPQYIILLCCRYIDVTHCIFTGLIQIRFRPMKQTDRVLAELLACNDVDIIRKKITSNTILQTNPRLLTINE